MKHILFYTAIALIVLMGCKREDPSETINPLLDKYFALWNTGNIEGVENIIDPDFELRMAPTYKPEKGIETLKTSIKKWRTVYPDFNVKVEEKIIDKDKAAVRWTINATNTGEGSFPPTGRHVEVMGISIIHIKNGKVKDEWIAGNSLYWMQQLGYNLVPPEPVKKKTPK